MIQIIIYTLSTEIKGASNGRTLYDYIHWSTGVYLLDILENMSAHDHHRAKERCPYYYGYTVDSMDADQYDRLDVPRQVTNPYGV